MLSGLCIQLERLGVFSFKLAPQVDARYWAFPLRLVFIDCFLLVFRHHLIHLSHHHGTDVRCQLALTRSLLGLGQDRQVL